MDGTNLQQSIIKLIEPMIRSIPGSVMTIDQDELERNCQFFTLQLSQFIQQQTNTQPITHHNQHKRRRTDSIVTIREHLRAQSEPNPPPRNPTLKARSHSVNPKLIGDLTTEKLADTQEETSFNQGPSSDRVHGEPSNACPPEDLRRDDQEDPISDELRMYIQSEIENGFCEMANQFEESLTDAKRELVALNRANLEKQKRLVADGPSDPHPTPRLPPTSPPTRIEVGSIGEKLKFQFENHLIDCYQQYLKQFVFAIGYAGLGDEPANYREDRPQQALPKAQQQVPSETQQQVLPETQQQVLPEAQRQALPEAQQERIVPETNLENKSSMIIDPKPEQSAQEKIVEEPQREELVSNNQEMERVIEELLRSNRDDIDRMVEEKLRSKFETDVEKKLRSNQEAMERHIEEKLKSNGLKIQQDFNDQKKVYDRTIEQKIEDSFSSNQEKLERNIEERLKLKIKQTSKDEQTFNNEKIEQRMEESLEEKLKIFQAGLVQQALEYGRGTRGEIDRWRKEISADLDQLIEQIESLFGEEQKKLEKLKTQAEGLQERVKRLESEVEKESDPVLQRTSVLVSLGLVNPDDHPNQTSNLNIFLTNLNEHLRINLSQINISDPFQNQAEGAHPQEEETNQAGVNGESHPDLTNHANHAQDPSSPTDSDEDVFFEKLIIKFLLRINESISSYEGIVPNGFDEDMIIDDHQHEPVEEFTTTVDSDHNHEEDEAEEERYDRIPPDQHQAHHSNQSGFHQADQAINNFSEEDPHHHQQQQQEQEQLSYDQSNWALLPHHHYLSLVLNQFFELNFQRFVWPKFQGLALEIEGYILSQRP
ncbi:hypothetical protein H4Q26_001539 [Puccinia striiformis f. sp. tritici PST-130]|nr:hypothetical protein H4Q26_001539 [Puccinia striiformis f. sp. tritici PST-130]